MATPLKTFGRGPVILGWDGKPVPQEQFGMPSRGARSLSRGLTNDIGDRADDDEDDTFQSVNAPPSGIARPRQAKAAAAAEPEDLNTGIFNPMIAAPSPSVTAALAVPEGERSLAQKKLLRDRRGTEAMSASRGGLALNPISQRLQDEKTITAAGAQGRFNKEVESAYKNAYDGTTPAAAAPATAPAPGAPVAAATVTTPNATAAKVVTPPWDDPKNPANHVAATLGTTAPTAPATPTNGLEGRGYAMRTMDDGTVKVASGVGTGAFRNESNTYNYDSAAAARDVFRPVRPPAATAAPSIAAAAATPAAASPIATPAPATPAPATPASGTGKLSPSNPLNPLDRSLISQPPGASPLTDSKTGAPIMPVAQLAMSTPSTAAAPQTSTRFPSLQRGPISSPLTDPFSRLPVTTAATPARQVNAVSPLSVNGAPIAPLAQQGSPVSANGIAIPARDPIAAPTPTKISPGPVHSPWDDPFNSANTVPRDQRRAKSPWGDSSYKPPRTSEPILPQIKAALSYKPLPEEEEILKRRNKPVQSPAAARTTSPTTRLQMNARTMGPGSAFRR